MAGFMPLNRGWPSSRALVIFIAGIMSESACQQGKWGRLRSPLRRQSSAIRIGQEFALKMEKIGHAGRFSPYYRADQGRMLP